MNIGKHIIYDTSSIEGIIPALSMVLPDMPPYEGIKTVIADAELLTRDEHLKSEYERLINNKDILCSSIRYTVNHVKSELEELDGRKKHFEQLISGNVASGNKAVLITHKYYDAIAMLCACEKKNSSAILIYYDENEDLLEVLTELKACVYWHKYFQE